MHLVGVITRIYHDARPSEYQKRWLCVYKQLKKTAEKLSSLRPLTPGLNSIALFFCPFSLVISSFNEATLSVLQFYYYRGADKSLALTVWKQALKHVRDARCFNNIETRAVIIFLFLEGKAPKEIRAFLTEALACFLPGRAKDLSALL